MSISQRGGAKASPRQKVYRQGSHRQTIVKDDKFSSTGWSGANILYGICFVALVSASFHFIDRYFADREKPQIISEAVFNNQLAQISENRFRSEQTEDLAMTSFYWEENLPADRVMPDLGQKILEESEQQIADLTSSSVPQRVTSEQTLKGAPVVQAFKKMPIPDQVIPSHKPYASLAKRDDGFTQAYHPSGRVSGQMWQKNAIPVLMSDSPKIAIVIDDLGFHHKRLDILNHLPGPKTYAFLPYAHHLQQQVDASRQAGNEILVHMPMQPLSDKNHPGPGTLKTEMGEAELRQTLLANLAKMTGYVGINNHMGSKLTSDSRSMEIVMSVLKQKGLLYLDSRTIATSVGYETAKKDHLPVTKRDVFIDHVMTQEKIQQALAKVEHIARVEGQAIAIGHPSELTVEALEAWLPTLAEKGFQLVPVSALAEDDYPELLAKAE